MSIPNILTFFRICLIPFFVLFFYLDIPNHNLIAVILFMIAGFTDWLDGYLARKWKQTSKLGAFLDPVADKLMVAVALVLIVSAYPYWWVAVPCSIIVAREMIVSALREWMAELGERAVVKVSQVGKAKTLAQISSIVLLLLGIQNLYNFWVIVSFLLLYISVILTIYSMFIYLKASYVVLKNSK